jgi:hypothetical protein
VRREGRTRVLAAIVRLLDLVHFRTKGAKCQTFVLCEPDVVPVVTALARRRAGGDGLSCFKEWGR